MRRLIFGLVVISLCVASGIAQSRRRERKPNPKQPATTAASVQEKLVRQLVLDGQFTDECVRKSGGAAQVVSIEKADLNHDGKPEYLIRLEDGAQGECTPAMTLWCYRETSSGYVKLLSVSSDRTVNRTFDHFTGKKTYHNGFADLELVTVQGPYVEFTDYVFNGTRYAEAKHGAERVSN
jgi:hypothetical protein